jgi:sec-independent protein translocase protein TatB
MEIFGIGASELLFIILIAIIVLGPKDMQKAGRTIGRFLNQLIQSDSWKVFQRTSNELRNLPRNLMREANMEMMEAEKDLHRVIDPRANAPAFRSSSSRSVPPSNEMENATQSEPPIPDTNQSSADAARGEDEHAELK